MPGVWPWNAGPLIPFLAASSELCLSHQLAYQYLAGLLIGLGVGGVVGASTLGVAMFSLLAPPGHLVAFTAVVPVVNCVANLGTISVYLRHANWSVCYRMWPAIMAGIAVGTLILPSLDENLLRRFTSVLYALVLVQRVHEKLPELLPQKPQTSANPNGKDKVDKQRNEAFYQQLWVGASVGGLCGVVTVVTNNSGPIFNVYLLACGLDMDQFVATRSVMMAGKNVAKVGMRALAGRLSWPVAVHGLQIGLLALVGIQLAKPIKRRTSPECYMYFTWFVLLYTAIKMWFTL